MPDNLSKHLGKDLIGHWIYAVRTTNDGDLVGSFFVERGDKGGLSICDGKAHRARDVNYPPYGTWSSSGIAVGVNLVYVKYAMRLQGGRGYEGTIELSRSGANRIDNARSDPWTGSFLLKTSSGPMYAMRLHSYRPKDADAGWKKCLPQLLDRLHEASVWTDAHGAPEFKEFFGRSVGNVPVDLVFCQRRTREVGNLDPFEYAANKDGDGSRLWPEEGTRLHPTDVKGWLAVEDVDAATQLSKLFGNRVRICTDLTLPAAWATEENTTVALGLGFTRHTRDLLNKGLSTRSNLSRYVQIVWPWDETTSNEARTDAIVFNGRFYGESQGGEDYAIVARVVDDRGVVHFVCAGRTARGTEAAGLFLADNWQKLRNIYKYINDSAKDSNRRFEVKNQSIIVLLKIHSSAPKEAHVEHCAPVDIDVDDAGIIRGVGRDYRDDKYEDLLADAIVGVLEQRTGACTQQQKQRIKEQKDTKILKHWLQESAVRNAAQVIASRPGDRPPASTRAWQDPRGNVVMFEAGASPAGAPPAIAPPAIALPAAAFQASTAVVSIVDLKKMDAAHAWTAMTALHGALRKKIIEPGTYSNVRVLSGLTGAIVSVPDSLHRNLHELLPDWVGLASEHGLALRVGISRSDVEVSDDVDGRENVIGPCVNNAARLASSDENPGTLYEDCYVSHASPTRSLSSVVIKGKRGELFTCFPGSEGAARERSAIEVAGSTASPMNAALIAYDLPAFSEGGLRTLVSRFQAVVKEVQRLRSEEQLKVFFSPGGDGGVLVLIDIPLSRVIRIAKTLPNFLDAADKSQSAAASVKARIGVHYGQVFMYENAEGVPRPTGPALLDADGLAGDEAARKSGATIVISEKVIGSGSKSTDEVAQREEIEPFDGVQGKIRRYALRSS